MPEAVDLLEHGELVGCGGGHDLSADIVVDTVLLGKSHQLVAPLDAIGGLEAAGGVVEPAVDDATVVAGLVVAQDVLFFQQGNAGPQGWRRCSLKKAAAPTMPPPTTMRSKDRR